MWVSCQSAVLEGCRKISIALTLRLNDDADTPMATMVDKRAAPNATKVVGTGSSANAAAPNATKAVRTGFFCRGGPSPERHHGRRDGLSASAAAQNATKAVGTGVVKAGLQQPLEPAYTQLQHGPPMESASAGRSGNQQPSTASSSGTALLRLRKQRKPWRLSSTGTLRHAPLDLLARLGPGPARHGYQAYY